MSDLKSEADAVHLLMATLRDIDAADDEELVRDSIEGQTGFMEAIDRTLAHVAEDMARCEALTSYSATIAKRLERIQHRIDMTKVAVMTAMSFAEQRKLVRPLATLSIRPTPQSVTITAEADIPAEFWKKQDPKLDRRAIGEALKSGTAVSGAELSNGGETLSWSFK